MRFTKMHGIGNDFVVVDGFVDPIPNDRHDVAAKVCDRRRGVGADGLLVVEPAVHADARMSVYNADGSEAEMCGNGLRCVVRLLVERGRVDHGVVRIATGRGVLEAEVVGREVDGDECAVDLVTVDMGSADQEPELVRVTLDDRQVDARLVGMGNPHCVVFVDDVSDDWVLGVGPRIERHPMFPHRTNVEFARIDGPDELTMRVWERGCGETPACGTGACAAVVAGVSAGRLRETVLVHLPGGDLEIDWTGRSSVLVTGTATEVFRGDWTPPHAARRAA